MGNLLGAPVTEKATERGVTNEGPENSVAFAVSSMQGWRVHMEDAHIAEARLYAAEPSNSNHHTTGGGIGNHGASTKKEDWHKLRLPGHALFAVFDGHGGSYSAMYAGRNMCRVLSRQPKFVQYAKLYEQQQQQQQQGMAATAGQPTPTTHANLKLLVQLLHGALTDAFIDLDKEICLALRGTKVPDADQPYHDQNNPDDGGDNHNSTDTSEGMAVNTSATNNSSVQYLEEEGDSGTTACVVLLTPDVVVCANAGDSRAILRQWSGPTIPLSYDHKPDDESEQRRIRAAGGYVAAGRVEGDLAVSRGLGDFRFKNREVVLVGSNSQSSNTNSNMATPPSTSAAVATATSSASSSSSVVTRPGDQKVSPIPDIMVHPRNPSQDAFWMIACDGIWDVQSYEHASKIVYDVFQEGETDLGLICEEVCDICLRLGSKDNMTVLILQFPGYVHRLRQERQQQQQQGQSQQQAQSQQQQPTTTTGKNKATTPSKGGSEGGVLSRRRARDAPNIRGNVFSSSQGH